MPEEIGQQKEGLTCGLIMPISPIDTYSADHWEEVRTIIKESLEGLDFKIKLVSDSNEIGIIQNRIVNNIYNSDIVICDVSGKNPNVMFELGMRLAFDKPTVIIKDNETNYSFDTAPIEHIEYPRDLHYQSIVDFKETLNAKVSATYTASLRDDYTTFLKHFGEFKISKISQEEISSDNYIIKAIDDLTYSMRRMELKALPPVSGSIALLPDAIDLSIDKIIDDTIDDFLEGDKYRPTDLRKKQDVLSSRIADQLGLKFNISKTQAHLLTKGKINKAIAKHEIY